MDGVARSNRVSSTPFGHIDPQLGFMLGGFVAGEGCFTVTRRLPPYRDGMPRLRFTFCVTVASRDEALLAQLRAVLAFGSIHHEAPARPGRLPLSTLTVASVRAHVAATIPFFDRFLPTSAKRHQFELWRTALQSYLAQRPKNFGRGRSVCSEPGCDRFVRGRGLCRSHYYRATGY